MLEWFGGKEEDMKKQIDCMKLLPAKLQYFALGLS